MPTRAVSVPRAYIEMFLDRLDAIRCLRSRRHSPPGPFLGADPRMFKKDPRVTTLERSTTKHPPVRGILALI